MDGAINQRLKSFFLQTGMSQIEFSKSIFVNNVSITKWFTFEEKFPIKHIFILMRTFPELNIRWLLTGDGDMFDRSYENSNVDIQSIKPEDKMPPEIINSIKVKIEDLRYYIHKLEEDKEYLRNIVNANRKKKEFVLDMLVNEIKNSDIEERKAIFEEIHKIVESDQYSETEDVNRT